MPRKLTLSLGIRMKQEYWVQPKDKAKLLKALMEELAGEAQILLEGDLSDCDFSNINNRTTEISGELHQTDKGDKTSIKVLALDNESMNQILEQVLANDRFIEKIDHIQIQKNSELQVLIGDNFDDECISVGPLVSVKLLESLKDSGVIEGYQTDAEARAKYPWFNA